MKLKWASIPGMIWDKSLPDNGDNGFSSLAGFIHFGKIFENGGLPILLKSKALDTEQLLQTTPKQKSKKE